MENKEYTSNEKYWIDIINRDEILLQNMREITNSDPTVFSKRDLVLTERFIEFLKRVIKYENFRPEEPYTIHKRLVRIHNTISTKEMDAYGWEYIIFNGLYVVVDVMFLDPEVCKEFNTKPTQENKKLLGIPDDVADYTIKFVNMGDKECAVALLKSDPRTAYVPYNSRWEYTYFDEGADIYHM